MQAMQFFDFIFLARSWASDRLNLTSHLSSIAAHHMTTTRERAEDDEPLALIIFPEGTLVSPDTVPISQKYAEKMGLVCPASYPCHAAYSLIFSRSTHGTCSSLAQQASTRPFSRSPNSPPST
jgi:hypothetical protein